VILPVREIKGNWKLKVRVFETNTINFYLPAMRIATLKSVENQHNLRQPRNRSPLLLGTVIWIAFFEKGVFGKKEIPSRAFRFFGIFAQNGYPPYWSSLDQSVFGQKFSKKKRAKANLKQVSLFSSAFARSS
jgi:hypothetical protein